MGWPGGSVFETARGVGSRRAVVNCGLIEEEILLVGRDNVRFGSREKMPVGFLSTMFGKGSSAIWSGVLLGMWFPMRFCRFALDRSRSVLRGFDVAGT